MDQQPTNPFDTDDDAEMGTCECGKPAEIKKMPWGNDTFPVRCDDCRARDELESKEREERQEEERKAANREADRLSRIALSWIPPALHDVEAPYGNDAAFSNARRWVLGEIDGLLFTGPPGVGKTHLAAWAAWQRVQRPMSMVVEERFGRRRYIEQLKWISAPELFNLLSYPFESQERERATRLLTSTAPLVLDDLDKARPSDFGAEQVFLAIDNALNHRRPLIVTTNMPVSGLARRWPTNGDAIASRLAGYCRQHAFGGGDRRLQSAA